MDGDILPAMIFGALCLQNWVQWVSVRFGAETVVSRRHLCKQPNLDSIKRDSLMNLLPSQNQGTKKAKIDGNDDESDGGGRWLMNEDSIHG